MKGPRSWWLPVLLLLVVSFPQDALWGARISEIEETGLGERVRHFFALEAPSLRYALGGSLLLGLSCGLMGGFLVVRRLALMGDALSHAVLPGVVLGFLWNMKKDPVAIFVGATLAALLGAAVVQALRHTTRHKEDAALGFVLASFYGVGICLLTMLQQMPGGHRSGLDKFMFGQAAAMGAGDVGLLAGVCAVVVVLLGVYFKEFALTSFDAGFARALGLPVQVFHYGLMLLLAFAIVSALQAVGVVLVSAMLVIPAATAYLLTQRLGPMLVLAALLGMGAGGAGAFFSFVGKNMPTGPLMVLSAGLCFVAAFLFAPRHGVVVRGWRHRAQSRRVRLENFLKGVYGWIEAEGGRGRGGAAADLARHRGAEVGEVLALARAAERVGWARVSPEGQRVELTDKGWQRACEVVRNHRLWELYLTHAADFAPDHVHDDAEKIEHVLGEETVRLLERRLGYPVLDPHGKVIPVPEGRPLE